MPSAAAAARQAGLAACQAGLAARQTGLAARQVGFVGLGAMGRPMARRVAATAPTVVFDRAPAAVVAAERDGGVVAARNLEPIARSDVIVTSLPRSRDVLAVAEGLIATGELREGSVWVDTTSGVPQASVQLASELKHHHGVCFVDAGVAGGPAGAASGTLTAMVGADSTSTHQLARAQEVLDTFCAQVVHVGPTGAGHAVKAVNNALLATHLLAAYEGLLTLAKRGVPAGEALAAINRASGRSLVTEERIPRHVLAGDFDFGFEMGLLLKDVETAAACAQAAGVDTPVMDRARSIYREAARALGSTAEHMEVLRLMERQCGAELRATPEGAHSLS